MTALTPELLQSITAADGKLPPGLALDELTPAVTAALGSTDSDLREAALDALWTWIALGFYPVEQERAMGAQMAANLRAGLGEPEGDRVFLRSFSALILEAVIEHDGQCRAGQAAAREAFLSAEEVRGWLEDALAYSAGEQDTRGYVAGKGWAHSAAHTADLLGTLAGSPFVGRAGLERILAAAADKMTALRPAVFAYDEEKRTASAVLAVLMRGLVETTFVEEWIEGMANPPGGWKESYFDPASNAARVNTGMFLRRLYFLVRFGKQEPAQRAALVASLERSVREMDGERFYG